MSTAAKWRELSEDEKPARGMEIRIPGDKQPLGVVIKVGPSGITYRPHGGGALQLIIASAEVEVRALGDSSEEKEQEQETEKTGKVAKKATNAKTKKSKAASVKPKQLEIVEEEESTETEETEEEEIESETNNENEAEIENGNENGNESEETVVAPTPNAKGWMDINELVAKSNVPLGRILKARREGAFTGMVRPDPDYAGVGRKPLIYSSAALKVAMGLSGGGGKGGRPPGTGKSANPKARRVSESSAAEKPARMTAPPKRYISQPATSGAPAQSHLYAAGESLQVTLDGINAEIARLTELKEKLTELWSFFEV